MEPDDFCCVFGFSDEDFVSFFDVYGFVVVVRYEDCFSSGDFYFYGFGVFEVEVVEVFGEVVER